MDNPRYIKLEYSSGSVIYKGLHLNTLATTDDPNWKITKFTYDGADITDIQIAVDAWDNRATIF